MINLCIYKMIFIFEIWCSARGIENHMFQELNYKLIYFLLNSSIMSCYNFLKFNILPPELWTLNLYHFFR